MTDVASVILRDGTLVRHKGKGYEGRIEGTTAIKTCFTRGGDQLEASFTNKEAFQYRVAVTGRLMRFIAPMEDLEILEAPAAIVCIRCSNAFRTKPRIAGKAGGRCACGAWICPVCLGCRADDTANQDAKPCLSQQKRIGKKLLREKNKRPRR